MSELEEVAARVGKLYQGQVMQLRRLPILGMRESAVHPDLQKAAASGQSRDDSATLVVGISVASAAVMIVTQTCAYRFTGPWPVEPLLTSLPS